MAFKNKGCGGIAHHTVRTQEVLVGGLQSCAWTIGEAVLKVDLVTTRAEWVAVLQQMGRYDYCHSFDFHRISAKNGEGEPILFAVRDDADRFVFCWPALLRKIPGTPWCDLTSVYGYGGPLLVGRGSARAYLELVLNSMRELGAVSVFSRMHPVFMEQLPDDPALRGEYVGDVVVIDVAEQPEPITSYRSDHRRGIRRALKAGVTTEIDAEAKQIDEFLDVYTQAMEMLEADAYYHFDLQYLSMLRDASEFHAMITFARFEGKNIATGLSLISGGIMQAYLGGSLPEYRKLASMKLVTAVEHQFAVDQGLDLLILGGGLGLANDHLLQFKRGFAHNVKPFNLYKKILNQNAYETLCRRNGVDANGGGYFPAYRFGSSENNIE